MSKRGYFAIGIENPKTSENVGTLWRSALIFGAQYVFTIGRRYKTQRSDTPKTPKHIPLFNYADFDDFYQHLPHDCVLTGIELDSRARDIKNFVHPERQIFLLGAEDVGLTKRAIESCHALIQLPGSFSMNVASAGTIVMYDKWSKMR